jgi:hypothetical protein
MMNDTYFEHLVVTSAAGETPPQGGLTRIRGSRPQADRHWVIAAKLWTYPFRSWGRQKKLRGG